MEDEPCGRLCNVILGIALICEPVQTFSRKTRVFYRILLKSSQNY